VGTGSSNALAISFFQGHGVQPADIQTGTCTTYTQCNHPGNDVAVGTSGYGSCVKTPISVHDNGAGVGLCFYTASPQIQTCSARDSTGHLTSVGSAMALGENTTVGAWRGAGTNGGTTLAIVHMSFGMLPFFPISEWKPVFAGASLYAGTMATDGDVEDSLGFGAAVANTYKANSQSVVATDYMNSMFSIMDGDGSCTLTRSGGAPDGINGCGCQVVVTFSNTNSGATYNIATMTWANLTSDNAQQTSTAYWHWGAACNYNTTTYPWSGGL
jgi:hypothetical protein